MWKRSKCSHSASLASLVGLLSKCSIIAIPGYGTPPVEAWDLELEVEKSITTADGVSKAHIYAFEFDTSFSCLFEWQMILSRGNDLLEQLARLHAASQVGIVAQKHIRLH
jgi:hypothetical protein